MYNVGDIIATRLNAGNIYLTEIVNVEESLIYCKHLYTDKMEPRYDNYYYNRFVIDTESQSFKILPKEEYFKAIQDKINEQQEQLNFIKEKYNV